MAKRAPDDTTTGKRRVPATRKGRRGARRDRTLDLEAIGLVLLAFGLAATAMLVPAFPSGDLGEGVRSVVVTPLGWGAWLLPWPFLVLGGLFLLRRSPRAWPRVLAGYVLTGVGAWTLLMLSAPALAGTLGLDARAALAGAAGALAYVPAVLLVTLGIELVVGWAPTLIVRRVLGALVRAVRATGKAAWRARVRARARAAFRADVRRVRRELQELDRDLAALAGLYPGSGELARWRESVQRAVAAVRQADAAGLDVARADVAAWRSAVGDFARDRAQELAHQLRAEAARPPTHDASDLDAWGRHVKAVLDEPLTLVEGGQRGGGRRSGASPRAVTMAEGLRKAMALDLAALLDRHRRLARERDLAETGLGNARPRDLMVALQAHGERVQTLRAIESDAAALQDDVDRLDGWRGLLDGLVRVKLDHPEDAEVTDLDEELAGALRARGRAELAQLEGWSAALAAVSSGARARTAAAAAEEAAAAHALDVAPSDEVDTEATDDLFGFDEAPLLDDASVVVSENVAWVRPGEPVAAHAEASAAGRASAAADAPPWTPSEEPAPLRPGRAPW